MLAGAAPCRRAPAAARRPPACSIVMPDLRTVYATDDGTNVGFYKFVADKPEDLSSGGCHLE